MSGPFYVEVCANSTLTMNIQTNDYDFGDSVKLYYYGSVPGAVWSDNNNNNSVKFSTGTLTWTPTRADVSSSPYNFIVMAVDNSCPLNSRYSRTYQIIVKDAPVAETNHNTSSCGDYTFKMINSSGASIANYLWSGEGGIQSTQSTFNHQFTEPGSYIYTSKVSASNGCSVTYEDTVVTGNFLYVSLPGDTHVCYGSSISLQANAYYNQGATSFAWSNAMSGSQITVGPIVSDTSFTITVSDQSGCSNSNTIHISVLDLPQVDAGSDVRNVQL